MHFKALIELVKLRLILLFSPHIRKRVKRVAEDLFNEQRKISPKERVLYLLIGFTHAGKTTVINKDPAWSKCFRISTGKIHPLLNERLIFLQDGMTITGRAYWYRQFLTRMVRKQMMRMAMKEGLAIVNDSGNLKLRERKPKLAFAKRNGYDRTIIWVRCSEEELLRRLKEADSKKGDTTWQDLYFKIQKPRFNPPSPNEAESLLIYNNETRHFEH